MRILAIDPGTEQSGWVIFDTDTQRPRRFGTSSNGELLEMVEVEAGGFGFVDVLAIEMVASYGMAVGRDVFETVRWIGRFQQAWFAPEDVVLVYRQDVKLHLCNSARAKDGNVRQALVDRLGPQGKKKEPGPLYGVSGHMWSALAVAVTAADRLNVTAGV
jgi:hypothetical protein